MRFALASAILAIGAATSASAADISVTLQPTYFDPSIVTAQSGDTITFNFPSKNHTVTQSSFATPCQALDGGIDSGFEPVSDNSTETLTFTITVNDTNPLWFFCRQTGQCQNGQVFAVNPTPNQTFEEFQAAANSSSNSTPSSSSLSSTSTKVPSSTASSPSSTTSQSSTSSNAAISTGARAGGLLAAFGFVAGILL